MTEKYKQLVSRMLNCRRHHVDTISNNVKLKVIFVRCKCGDILKTVKTGLKSSLRRDGWCCVKGKWLCPSCSDHTKRNITKTKHETNRQRSCV